MFEPRFTDDELRRSFEVVPLSALPDTEGFELVPSRIGACCYHCEADWIAIATAAVEILHSGMDFFDLAALDEAARIRGLGYRDTAWLGTLFSRSSPITVITGSDEFIDGRHRTHALRAAGVAECVVYTGRGEGSDE